MNATYTKMKSKHNDDVFFVRYQIGYHHYYFHKCDTEREAVLDCNLLNEKV